jgi:8-oxo-dGTP diphosphatase
VSGQTSRALNRDGGGELVKAAGGLVCRPGPAGLVEVALVHRSRYDDWTLPKGKLDPGETLEEAGLREVEEETGLRCRLVRPVACTEYQDGKGRDKVVFYWVMHPVAGHFEPSQEVDELRWLTVEESLGLLSYERDRALLQLARPHL